MAWNLPPPWDPGFAMPENVKDEGLERRAFVTKQMPRGSYDNIKTGSAGFVLPGNVRREVPGQGTYTTKWEPRGQYDGGKVPNWLNSRPQVVSQKSFPGGNVVTIDALSGMGDNELPPAYVNYGRKGAAAIMARIAQVPPTERKRVLKATLDSIDKTLWKRVADLAGAYVKQGCQPGKALQLALARCLTTGIAAEVVNVGVTRDAPQARSLLGLGCYGPQGLGADIQLFGTTAPPNPPAGFTWDAGPPGFFRRLRAGETPAPSPPGAVVTTRDQSGSTAGVAPKVDMLQVGPFTLPVSGSSVILREATMSADQRKYLFDGIWNTFTKMVTYPVKKPAYQPTVAALAQVANATKAIQGTATVWDKIINGKVPLYRFDHPTTKKASGLFFKANATGWEVSAHEREWDGNVIGAIWDGITWLAAAIVSVVAEIVDVLSDLACTLAQSPGSSQAGAAIGVAAGAGAAAGQAGAEIAKGLCSSPVPIPPPPPPLSSSLVLPLAIAGGAVALALLLSKKKKP